MARGYSASVPISPVRTRIAPSSGSTNTLPSPIRPLRGFQVLITVHPSYLLRLQEERDKRREFDFLVRDLEVAAEAARKARR